MIDTFMKNLISCALLFIMGVSSASAQQVTGPSTLTITSLLNQGYAIVAASSDVQSHYIYLSGIDSTNKKKAYVCQIQFGQNGAFRGCILLP